MKKDRTKRMTGPENHTTIAYTLMRINEDEPDTHSS